MSKIIKKSIKSSLGLVGLGDEDKPPTPEAAKAAPDPDTEEAAKAKSRELQRRKRTGRTSTVLSEGTKLG